MGRSNEDLERVARRLDGENIELTASQQALARQVAADAARLARALDVPLPAGTLHRVHARLRQARQPGRAKWRIGRMVAAAAAVLLAGLGLLWVATGGHRPRPQIAPEVYVREFLKAPSPNFQACVAVIEEELAAAQVRLAWGEPPELEVALAGLEEELQQSLAGEDASSDEAVWQQWMESL